MIVGILLEYNFHFGIVAGILGIVVSLTVTIIFYYSKKLSRQHTYNFLNGLSYFGIWLFFGIFIFEYQLVPKPEISEEPEIHYAVVTSSPEEKAKTYKSQLRVLDSAKNQQYEVLAYFDKQQTIPRGGDLIAFYSEIQYLESNHNPLEFDYAKYMSRQGIYCKTTVKNNEYVILVPDYQRTVKYYGSLMRDNLLKIYKSQNFSSQQLAVLEALTLGYKSDLDEETISAFQSSGSMHILAVSGLHTGIIMMIISFLLKFLDFSKRGRYIRFFIIVATLWLFAAVTGFSASVCRSALMFSLIAFSSVTNRRNSSFTTLAFSAFVLLIINPLQLFNVGFLLSYLAVLSILVVMPWFDSLQLKLNYISDKKLKLAFKWFANYFIGVILVSIAAQVGTTVLSISTFNQFPVYFMLTNIFVIPLSFFIMIGSVMMLTFCWLPVVCSLIAKGLELLLTALIGSVSWIENLPGSSIKAIYLTHFSSVLLYIFIGLIVIYICYKKISVLKISLSVLVLFFVTEAYFDVVKFHKNSLIVYNKNNCTFINVLTSDTCKVITSKRNPDKNFLRPVSDFQNLTQTHNSLTMQIDTIEDFSDFYFTVNDYKVLILNDISQLETFRNENLGVDILVLCRNIYLNPEVDSWAKEAKAVIFSSGCSTNFVKKNISEFQSYHVATHDVKTQGAYVLGYGTEPLWMF